MHGTYMCMCAMIYSCVCMCICVCVSRCVWVRERVKSSCYIKILLAYYFSVVYVNTRFISRTHLYFGDLQHIQYILIYDPKAALLLIVLPTNAGVLEKAYEVLFRLKIRKRNAMILTHQCLWKSWTFEQINFVVGRRGLEVENCFYSQLERLRVQPEKREQILAAHVQRICEAHGTVIRSYYHQTHESPEAVTDTPTSTEDLGEQVYV